MKRLQFLLTATLAVAFLAVSVISCDSKSNRHNDEDDERTERSESRVEDDSEDEIAAIGQGLGVDSFCEDLDALTNKVLECTTTEEIEDIDNLESSLFSQYRNDDAVLTETDKQALTQSLALYAGTCYQMALDLSGEYMSEDDQYQMGYALGEEVAEIVENATTLSDVIVGLDNFGN